ncbi:hypothetical protein EV05_0470 [Prochlorococcus sp. MIT 0601]|nr:hypothetical protein EV05_0470 [Prochlorococcus sp. MIT 0601]
MLSTNSYVPILRVPASKNRFNNLSKRLLIAYFKKTIT